MGPPSLGGTAGGAPLHAAGARIPRVRACAHAGPPRARTRAAPVMLGAGRRSHRGVTVARQEPRLSGQSHSISAPGQGVSPAREAGVSS